MAQQTWTFPSSSGNATYTTQLNEDGSLTCDCRGWTMKRPDKPRECKHIKGLIKDNGWPRTVVGDLIVIDPSKVVDVPVVQDQSVERTDHAPPMAMKASGMTDPVTNGEFDAKYGDGQWVMEEKFDGHRCVVRKAGDQFTVNLAKGIPADVQAALSLLPDGVYDGELTVPGGNSWDVARLDKKKILILFDVLEIMGKSVMELTYTERHDMLVLAVQHANGHPALGVTTPVKPSWAEVERIWESQGEGVILKRVASRYQPGARGADWVKVKGLESHATTIIGFLPGSFGPHSIIRLRFDDGVETRVKTKNNDWLAMFAKDPESFIGRRLVIECQMRINGEAPRHPMAKSIALDHMAGEAE